MSIVRMFARPLLATGFVAAGVERLRNADQTAEQLTPTLKMIGKTVPAAAAVTSNPALVAKVVGYTQVGAATMLGMGKFSRLASFLLAGTAALTSVVEYRNAEASTAAERKERRSQLLKNLSLIGGVLLSAVDTNGRPGLAWRAGHLASGTGRKTRAVSKSVSKSTRKQLKAVSNAASDIVGS
ncbi:DoxX family membrane protein [Arthrobacter sp. zg-Y877]|uniref:DoxX family protein n=1 Tax=Arthrobacter sp. zg-Y877 TaxID=3049074 RepID=UPI0025A40DB9|nr:DoxX family membrane protein [Arthrobacter sp. zg-Y877]MDM7989770.1 DoxX family membrane protein [Arthrobacter sp. zg-Y877]